MATFVRIVILAMLLTTACSDAGDRVPVAGSAEKGVTVSRAEYGSDWPYTAESGLLYCDPPGSNVVLKAGGRVYALNGRAMGNAAERGYLNARDTITLRDENGYFTVGSSEGIISRGLYMCD